MRFSFLLFLPFLAYSCAGTPKGHHSDRTSTGNIIADMKNTLAKSKKLLHTFDSASLQEVIIDLESHIEVISRELENAVNIAHGCNCNAVSPDTPNPRTPRVTVPEDDIFPTNSMLRNVTFHLYKKDYYLCGDASCSDGLEGSDKTQVIGRAIAPSHIEAVKRLCPNGYQHLRHLGFTTTEKEGVLNFQGEGTDLGWVSTVHGACGATEEIIQFKNSEKYLFYYRLTERQNSAGWVMQDGGKAQFYLWESRLAKTKIDCQFPMAVPNFAYPEPWYYDGDVMYRNVSGSYFLKCPYLFVGLMSAGGNAVTFGGGYKCDAKTKKWVYTDKGSHINEGYEAPPFVSCGKKPVNSTNGNCYIADYQSRGKLGPISIYPGKERYCPLGYDVYYDGIAVKNLTCTAAAETHGGSLTIVTQYDTIKHNTTDTSMPKLSCAKGF